MPNYKLIGSFGIYVASEKCSAAILIRGHPTTERSIAMDLLPNLFLMTGPYESNDREISGIEQILRQFVEHEREEQEFLNGYSEIVEGCENPLVRFLLQLIMKDEEKHHGLVQSIATTLKDGIIGRRSEGGIPKFEPMTDDDVEKLKALTKEFIKSEKDGIKEYQALMKSCDDMYDGLLELLIQTIIHDSRKHMMILDFIKKKLEQS
jgi:rubrerythrin